MTHYYICYLIFILLVPGHIIINKKTLKRLTVIYGIIYITNIKLNTNNSTLRNTIRYLKSSLYNCILCITSYPRVIDEKSF